MDLLEPITRLHIILNLLSSIPYLEKYTYSPTYVHVPTYTHSELCYFIIISRNPYTSRAVRKLVYFGESCYSRTKRYVYMGLTNLFVYTAENELRQYTGEAEVECALCTTWTFFRVGLRSTATSSLHPRFSPYLIFERLPAPLSLSETIPPARGHNQIFAKNNNKTVFFDQPDLTHREFSGRGCTLRVKSPARESLFRWRASITRRVYVAPPTLITGLIKPH